MPETGLVELVSHVGGAEEGKRAAAGTEADVAVDFAVHLLGMGGVKLSCA